ncbi:hypothetical protein ACFXD5_35760 [Streptomyces sp. NPDC059385]|uniref:hypothetical protein n=1 Tax=Streptomyces sp. NPDC059385 TaxID=3346817 RepID=UPI0036829896
MFIRPVGVTVRSADRPSGHPLLRGLLAQATGTGSVDVDEPRQGVRWRTTGPIEPEPVGVEEAAGVEDGWEGGLEGGLEDGVEGGVEGEAVGSESGGHGEGDHAQGGHGEGDHAQGGHAEGGHTQSGPVGSFVAELTQLAALAREGLLTPQEFATAKGRLLRE